MLVRVTVRNLDDCTLYKNERKRKTMCMNYTILQKKKRLLSRCIIFVCFKLCEKTKKKIRNTWLNMFLLTSIYIYISTFVTFHASNRYNFSRRPKRCCVTSYLSMCGAHIRHIVLSFNITSSFG